ncbi:MAG: hypothetical protein KatS3mg102_0755 [Planctomycetota bacterium]|nr:MAG: hypothetical protein KatS3mg102_0755 [Planctomycetota bacterium]
MVRYVQPRGLLQVLLGARGKQPALSAQALLELARPRLLALWPQGG